MTAPAPARYRRVLRNREYVAILLSQALSVLGDQLARIAVAVLVFDRTASPLLASATYAASYLTYLLGGPFLASIADRRPRRGVMIACDVLRAPLVLVLCFTGVPLWLVFAVLALVGLLSPPFDSARSAMQPDILLGDDYVLGSAVMQIVVQAAQVIGFGAGGALVAATSAQVSLAVDAGTFLVSAGLLVLLVRGRPTTRDPASRSSVLTDTREGLQVVLAHPTLRRLLGYALLGSAAVIGPEGLAVPVADGLGRGALTAGLLTASVPLGFLIGSLAVLRVPVERRQALLPWLALLSCAPLLLSAVITSPVALGLLWLVAGTGGSVNLIASSAYMQTSPREFRGRTYGVATTALCAVQGLALLLSGALAEPLGPRGAVAALGALTLGALVLTVGRGALPAQAPARTGR